MNAPLPTERQVQRGILSMCGVAFPSMFVTHVPNGAHLAGSPTARFKQMGALKGDGLKPGFFDLLCLWSPGRGASIEVKRPKLGVVSDVQKAMKQTLDRVGWPNIITSDIDEAYMFLRRLGAPWNGVDPRRNKVQDEYHLGPVPEPCGKCGWLYGHAEGCK